MADFLEAGDVDLGLCVGIWTSTRAVSLQFGATGIRKERIDGVRMTRRMTRRTHQSGRLSFRDRPVMFHAFAQFDSYGCRILRSSAALRARP
jgi:hypothetical protein